MSAGGKKGKNFALKRKRGETRRLTMSAVGFMEGSGGLYTFQRFDPDV
jgi:hypothetical protein